MTRTHRFFLTLTENEWDELIGQAGRKDLSVFDYGHFLLAKAIYSRCDDAAERQICLTCKGRGLV